MTGFGNTSSFLSCIPYSGTLSRRDVPEPLQRRKWPGASCLTGALKKSLIVVITSHHNAKLPKCM